MPEVPLREVPTLDEVERRVAEMWSEVAADGKTVLRACKMNLVVVTGPGDDLPRLLEDLGRITDMEPGRVLVVSPVAGKGGEGLKPWIAAHCHLGPGGHPVCSEQVVLEVTAQGEALVPEAVRRLLVSDVPVFVWWRAALAHEPLLTSIREMADRFIVNSAGAEPAAGVLPLLASMTELRDWPGNVGDLAWVRTEAWREIVASMFDPPETRVELSRLRSVGIDCCAGPGDCGSTGLYLAGWLASRLEWKVEGQGRARRPDGGAVEVGFRAGESSVPGRITRVHLEAEGGTVFEASRTRSDGPAVRVLGKGRVPRLRRVQPLDDLTLLHGELQRDGRDPIFEEALRAAAALS